MSKIERFAEQLSRNDGFTLWKKYIKSGKTKLVILLVILIILFIGSFNFGRYTGIGLDDAVKILISKIYPIEKTWEDVYETVVLYIRFPRIFGAVIIGAALSVAGTAYQTVFRNPMVSPDILGSSSGASLGAALAITSGLSGVMIQLYAFIGGLGVVALTVLVSLKVKRDPILSLVLSGIFIGSFINALNSLMMYLATEDELEQITYWMMGSISSVTVKDIGRVIILMLIGFIPLYLVRWRLNVLSMGENEARALGVETGRLRIMSIMCATLLTACCVSIAGQIGFVGLVTPHLMRILIGTDNKVVIPASILGGGIFLLLVDNIARNLTSSEIPLGVITSIIGAPFFIALLTKERRAKMA